MLTLRKINFRRKPLLAEVINCFSSEALKTHQSRIMGKGLPTKKPIPGVKHIIVVSSGKGGVGKSTTSVNLAAALKLSFPEKQIGLLDTDVFGPTIPLMMNLNETPLVNDKNLMIPLRNYGVKCMSMGFLIQEGAPVIWRGLMVMQALEKLLRQVDWDSLDFLIVDTPPGTGDTHLSLVQNIPISGVILITSPQPAALKVTKRGAVMYQKLAVPIIGLVENMASIQCPSCSQTVKICGEATSSLASEINVRILESFPLEQEISISTDSGVPIVIKNQSNTYSQSYLRLAKKVVDFFE